MSTGAEVVKAFTEAGFPSATTEAVARYLREAGLVPKASRGRPGTRSPRWEVEHFASFLLGFGGDQPSDAPECVKALRQLPLRRTTTSSSFTDWMAGTSVRTERPVKKKYADGAEPNLGWWLETGISIMAEWPAEKRAAKQKDWQGSFLTLTQSPPSARVYWLGQDENGSPSWTADHFEEPRQNSLALLLRPAPPRVSLDRSTSIPLEALLIAGELLAETWKKQGTLLPPEGSDEAPASAEPDNEKAADPARPAAPDTDNQSPNRASGQSCAEEVKAGGRFSQPRSGLGGWSPQHFPRTTPPNGDAHP